MLPNTIVNMLIIHKACEIEDYTAHAKNDGKSIGFVPTMGSLHAGHLSLVERCVNENDISVVSVFVNPTQFNNAEDLATYPRDAEADAHLLAQAGVSAVFMPEVEDIYPHGTRRDHDFDLGSAADVMEGKYRPGHFQGVAQVVSRLFSLVRPDRAYFGEKDFQQIAVIRNMIDSEGIDVDIIPCPIKRAVDGLALSSRNALLTSEQRAIAPEIHKALLDSQAYALEHSVDATRNSVTEYLDAIPGLRVEYFEIVDARTLLPVADWAEADWIVGCITVYCGSVRLIDNITYKTPSHSGQKS